MLVITTDIVTIIIIKTKRGGRRVELAVGMVRFTVLPLPLNGVISIRERVNNEMVALELIFVFECMGV